MENYENLKEQLAALPNGYISKKRIKGKVYYYLQYISDGKIVSKYIPKKQLAEIEELLNKRKEIKNKVKELKSSFVEMQPLTKRQTEFTGSVMAGDKVVAKLYKGTNTYINNDLVPLYIKKNQDVKGFFMARSIDTRRENARSLLKILGIKETSSDPISLYVNGCSLIDNYWFKPSGASIKYKSLHFRENLYFDLSLYGTKKEYPVGASKTPDITTIGSFDKSWKFENGEWWLYKKESHEEIFSEIFISKLAKYLEIDTVEYIKENDSVKSNNFASTYNFESLYGLLDNAEDIVSIYKFYESLDKELAKKYIKLAYLDALIYNIDRTLNDLGVLRDKNTGEIVDIAPNFDNNCALISILPRLDIAPKNDPLIKNFIDFINTDKDLRKTFIKMKLPKLNRDILKKIVAQIDTNRSNSEDIIDFVLERYNYIAKNI